MKTIFNNLSKNIKINPDPLKRLMDMIIKKPVPIPVLAEKKTVIVMKRKNDFLN